MTEQNGVGRSSATETMRRLLDERGVVWWNQTDPEPQTVTMARFGDQLIEYHENVNGTMGYHVWNMRGLTPEQAIAATLGSVSEKDSERDSDGRGTCHDTHESRWFHCSECGFGLSDLYTEAPWAEEDQPKHCPNCGRRIKED